MCSCNFKKRKRKKTNCCYYIYQIFTFLTNPFKKIPLLTIYPIPLWKSIIFHQFSKWALMKPKPLWVLSNWIKKKENRYDREVDASKKNWDYGIMRRHLSYHYNWYVLPDKSFIICKVCDVFWATTSINFLVILSFYYTTHLFFQTQNTLVQMNFLVLFSFPKNCLKSLPCIKKILRLLLVIFNYYSKINGRISMTYVLLLLLQHQDVSIVDKCFFNPGWWSGC